MRGYGFKFDRNRKRVKTCPCEVHGNDDGKFAPFVGETKYGYCHSCEKVFLPDTDRQQQEESFRVSSPIEERKRKQSIERVSYIPSRIMHDSLRYDVPNYFVQGLMDKFPKDRVITVLNDYGVGTSKYWRGANVFWLQDIFGKIRSGKIMLYDRSTLHRSDKFNFVHRVLRLSNFNYKPCCFGESLLAKFPTLPVVLVESEKAAVICRICDASFVCLATGGKGLLKNEMCEVLRDRYGYIVPDVDGYEHWKRNAKSIGSLRNFEVTSLLQSKAMKFASSAKWDIADFILRELAENEIERE